MFTTKNLFQNEFNQQSLLCLSYIERILVPMSLNQSFLSSNTHLCYSFFLLRILLSHIFFSFRETGRLDWMPPSFNYFSFFNACRKECCIWVTSVLVPFSFHYFYNIELVVSFSGMLCHSRGTHLFFSIWNVNEWQEDVCLLMACIGMSLLYPPVKKLMKEKLSEVDRSSIIEIQAVRFSSTGLVH